MLANYTSFLGTSPIKYIKITLLKLNVDKTHLCDRDFDRKTILKLLKNWNMRVVHRLPQGWVF
jgi:hypothetical protein